MRRMAPTPRLGSGLSAIVVLAMVVACATSWTARAGATEASSSPLPLPAGAPVLPPADGGTESRMPLPPLDVRPPLPLPGESGRLERQANGACSAPDEAACGAVPTCAWVKVYGTVPGQPTAGFCHPRAAMPADAGPRR